AGPKGAEVIHGQVSIQQSDLSTVIHASDKSVINYTSFDIARPEIVQFIQPGSNASVLNRILSANPTCIDGTLLANGRVFFVNPAGVIIGSGATINVNQLVASGLNISNDSFINGQYEFVGGGGSVTNYGDISAKSVYLVGKQVTNAGNINCPDGYVVMAAGDKVFLGQPGSSVIVEIGSLEPPDQIDTQTPVEIINEGTVEAESGTIILAAAGDAFSRPIMTNIGTLSTSNANGDAGNISLQAGDGLIDNTGIITATSNSNAGGTITAVAGEVINTGTIDVSGSQGGTVALEAAERLGQFGTVRADGIDGDGGNINLTASEIVTLGTGSLTTANAGTNGNGGEVIAFSPETAIFGEGAHIEVKGGIQSGDGGFAEISGIKHVQVQGFVDGQAPRGNPGMFLIDPHDVTISEGGGTGEIILVSWLEDQLNNYVADVEINTDGDGEGDGWLHVLDPFGWTTDNGLTLKAHTNMEINAAITNDGFGNLILDAGSDITVNAEINLNGGLFTAHAGNSTQSGILSINQDITAGSMILTAGNQYDYDSGACRVYVGYTPVYDERYNAGEGTFDTTVDLVSTNSTTGDITIEAVHDVFIGGKVQAEGNVVIRGDVEGSEGPEYGGDVITKSDVTAGGSIEINSNAIDIDGNVRANGGNLVIIGRSSVEAEGLNEEPRGTVLDENAEWGDIDVATGKTLFASGDISIIDYQNGGADADAGHQMTLTGHDSLTIEAGGVIDATDVVIGVLGSSLALKQAGNLDLVNFNFDFQNNTYLTLVSDGYVKAVDSYNGGKNANAADQWASVSATAGTNIILQGSSDTRDITTESLTSINGYIEVKSDDRKILATENITADNGSITLNANNGIDVTDNITAETGITLTGPVHADGGGQVFDAGSGTLLASDTITKTTTGDLTLGGDGGIDLDGTVDVKSGSLTLEDNTTVASGQMLKASDDVILFDGKTLTGTSSLTIEATNGEIKAAGTGSSIGVSGSMLTLKQGLDLDLANFTFNNQLATDLTAQSYNGSFTADNTNAANAADQWNSITATAEDNIELSGSGNINIASAGLSSSSGGVKIVSTDGTISTPGAGGKLDAPITGSSNGTTGVDLPGGGKVAIVIISKDTLKLGPGAEMTANGTYGSFDDRSGIDFLNVIEGDKNPGNPFDVAVYLASNTGNINISSPVTIAADGAMVVDAYDTVESFGTDFLNSLVAIDRLEVCSRITPTLNYARDNDTLPYASDPGLYPGNGAYVLRGEEPDVGTGAWVLEEEIIPERTPIEAEVTSTEVPVTPDISDIGQIENTTISNDLQWLGEELGLCEGDQQSEDENQCQEITQAYLAGAFLQASDLRPHQAAAQLRGLAELLHDTDGSRIAALGQVINEFAQPNVPPSPEQFASIGQSFTQHINDGTHYASAKQWLDALGEYTMLLISEIGWSSDDSVAFVMGKYGPTMTEAGNISVIAFIQMHLEDVAG
ncbi:MAG: two-partner secretion domain-containing protein, partial [Planctomycetota bacterium]